MNSPAPAKKPKTYLPAYDFIPAEGTPVEILPGIAWLRMPLPFELKHVNLWLLEGPAGWSIVDTGFNYGETLAHWEGVFSKSLKGKPVKNIFITHFHPDHFGLAGWLAEKTGVTVQMTPREQQMMRALTHADSSESLAALYRPYYIDAGVDGELLNKLMEKRRLYKKIVYAPPATILDVNLGDTVALGGRQWKLIGGGGHSPEHAGLYDAANKILIAGDLVLPDITPNISFFPGNDETHDPVGDYLQTLTLIEKNVPDDVLVLPSHGIPFKGLHKRIDEIREHHRRRLEKMRDICSAAPVTALQAMHALFSHRKLEIDDLFFALGETLAHLIHDEKLGKIERTVRNGVSYYSSHN